MHDGNDHSAGTRDRAPDVAPHSLIGPVLFVCGCRGASSRYRCDHPGEQLALQGIESVVHECHEPERLPVEALIARTIIMQRVPFAPHIDVMLRFASWTGALVVFESDDLIFDPQVLGEIPHLNTLPTDERRLIEDNCRQQAETFARCQLLLTSTEPIAEAARKLGKHAFVQRNGYSAEMARLAVAAAANIVANSGDGSGDRPPVVLGYFSGTWSHDLDFAVIARPLIAALRRYPSLRLRIVGPLRIDPGFQEFGERVERREAVDWRQLPELIAGVDVNLVPLLSPNRFCDAKSEVKYLEAGLVGVPTIATATPAFRHAITPGVTGFLAESVEGWSALLSDLVEHPELRQRLGQAAQQHILRDYSPEARAATLIARLEEMRGIVDREGPDTRPLRPITNAQTREELRLMAEALRTHNHRWVSFREVGRRAWELGWKYLDRRFREKFGGERPT